MPTAACCHENQAGARYCCECGVALAFECLTCAAALEPGAKFCSQCGTRAPATGSADKPARTEFRSGEAGAEFRHIAVLFCDLVGSTELSGRIDGEELRELLGVYHKACEAQIVAYGGHVAQYLGDGILAYFGYPRVHEDNAARAVRAGLGIQAALFRLEFERGLQLRARVGIHSGQVVIGEVGGDGRRETLALGNATNVAARVQALAAPGEIFVTEQVRRQVAHGFALEDAGAHVVKGLTQPLAVFRVVSQTAPGLVPRRERAALVGRAAELAQLLERWRRARQRHPQVMLVTGEPGIGKSRLIAEMRTLLEPEGVAWFVESALSDAQNTPFGVVRAVFTRAFGLDTGTPAQTALQQIKASLAQAGLDTQENAALLASLLDIAAAEHGAPLLLSAEQLRKRKLQLLADWVLNLARRAPTVFVIEDLHWADPSTLESLAVLVERATDVPLLLLLTGRSEFRVPWPLRDHHGVLTLTRLSSAEVRALIGGLVGAHAPSGDLLDRLAARSDGVPLFAEELACVLGERLDTATAMQEIPETLQDSLSARLDRLGPAREVTQIAAVLGRVFTRSLLKAVTALDEAPLDAALEANVQAELLVASSGESSEGDIQYTFRHALVQQAAYDSLLKRRRRELHTQVAQVLGERFGALCAARPEMLARHWSAAAQPDAASKAWQQAGQRALDHFAHDEASAHFEAALAALVELPESRERDRRELELQIVLSAAVRRSRGFAAPDAVRTALRVRNLADRLGDGVERTAVLLSQWSVLLCRGEVLASLELATQGRTAAEGSGMGLGLAAALVLEAGSQMNLGQFEVARASAARARKALRALGAHPMRGVLEGMACGFAGFSAALLVRTEETRQLGDEMLASVDEAGAPGQVPHALIAALTPLTWGRDFTQVVAVADRLLIASRQANIAIFAAVAELFGGWARALLEPAGEGMTMLRTAIDVHVRLGQRLGLGQFLGMLAQAQLAAGQVDEALASIEQGLQSRGEQVWIDTLLHNLRALALEAAHASPAKVEAAHREAARAGNDRSSPLLRLRATRDLAAFLAARGRASEAAALLVNALHSLPAAEGAPDHDDALALLTQISAGSVIEKTA